MPDVHNRTRYLAGCRCETCRAAQSEYARSRRQAKNAAAASGPAKPKPVVAKGGALQKTEPAAPTIPYKESVTAAVKAELETYVGAEKRPALAAMALSLARILDTPSALPQHAAAVGKLDGLLTSIAKHGVKQETKLSQMRAELRSA